MIFFVFGATAVAAADELEADWIAQGGAASTNGVYEAWRAEMLARRAKRLAPLRRAKARKRVDVDGQDGRLAMYPYPVDERNVVLSYLPQGWKRNAKGQLLYRDFNAPFALYWTDVDGARELLVAQNGKPPCGRPVPVCERSLPNVASVRPDETLKTGLVTVQDVYVGESMKGVKRGTVKSMRLVSLDYRQAGVGLNSNGGPGGGGVSSTPPALGNGTWDVKRVLGEVPVAADGSVAVKAPVRTPIYFQLLDENGRMVQSMRSWTVLQPGETASCVGCHESANTAPDFKVSNVAALNEVSEVKRPKRGFSFPKDVQPILDRRCVRCHSPHVNAGIPDLTGEPVRDMFSCRNWSRTSRLFTERLDKGHGKGITGAEKRVLACWVDLGVPFCDDYEESAVWDEKDRAFWAYYTKKRAEFATDAER